MHAGGAGLGGEGTGVMRATAMPAALETSAGPCKTWTLRRAGRQQRGMDPWLAHLRRPAGSAGAASGTSHSPPAPARTPRWRLPTAEAQAQAHGQANGRALMKAPPAHAHTAKLILLLRCTHPPRSRPLCLHPLRPGALCLPVQCACTCPTQAAPQDDPRVACCQGRRPVRPVLRRGRPRRARQALPWRRVSTLPAALSGAVPWIVQVVPCADYRRVASGDPAGAGVPASPQPTRGSDMQRCALVGCQDRAAAPQ